MKPLRKENQQDQGKEKEDYLAPTKIEQDNKASKNDREAPNLSDKELRDRLDNYSQIGGMMDHYFEVRAMKEKYLKKQEEVEQIRVTAQIYHAQGNQVGLTQLPWRELDKINKEVDQDLRNVVAKEAKGYYHENNSLSKTFRENKPSPSEMKQAFLKAKNKGIDKGR